MVEFFGELQGLGIKIDNENFIRVAKPLIFFNMLCAVVH